MNKLNLPLGICIVLVAIVVYASTPTIPSILTPNQTINMNDNISLVCTGATDPDGGDVYYQIYKLGTTANPERANTSQAWATAGTGGFVQGTDNVNRYVLRGSSGDTKNASTNFTFYDDTWNLNLFVEEGSDQHNITIDGTGVFGAGSVEVPEQTISINVSNWNDESNHTIMFYTDSGATGVPNRNFSFWWDGVNTQYSRPLVVNNTNGLGSLDVNVSGNQNTVCRACNETGSCSGYIDSSFTFLNFSYKEAGDTLNFNFLNETDGANMPGAINSLSIVFNTNDTGDYSYSFSNTSEASNYNFTLEPSGYTVDIINGTVSYSASGYPQRTATTNTSLTSGTLTTQNLYLLSSAEGLYVTFQVIDASNAPIKDVTVAGEAYIGGSYVEIVGGTTDDAGSITFWLNPNAQHRFTFSKTGYVTAISVITPTQSAYTQTLESTTTSVQNYNLGILYYITPTDNVLNLSTVYSFGFNISSSNYTLEEYGFTLTNSSGNVVASASDTTSSGGLASQNFNTANETRLTMNYYWNIEGNSTNRTVSWYVTNTTAQDLTLLTFLQDLKNFNKGGVDDFTRTIFFAFILVILVGTLVFYAGESEYIKYSIFGLIILITWIAEYTGGLPVIGTKYFITVVVSLMLLAFIIRDNVR